MSSRLSQIIDGFGRQRVLVIGEAILDVYLRGASKRLSPEAPVPVVALDERELAAGGAANTAVNVASLGAKVYFLSAAGSDAEGKALRQALKDNRVDARYLILDRERRTLAKHRIICGSQMVARYDQGTEDALSAECEDTLLRQLGALYPRCDAVIVSDYSYGVVTPRIVEALKRLQARYPRVLVVDSKEPERFREVDVTAVKPNYPEALRLLGLDDPGNGSANTRAEQLGAYGDEVLKRTGARIVAVTLDVDGALVFERGRPAYRTYAKAARNIRAAGAGDTFISALAVSLAAGATTPAAAEIAQGAATIVVRHDGTTVCSASELRAHFAFEDKYSLALSGIREQVQFYRKHGRRVVFTNGCFDILHRGHITYLNRAKALGDILIVGINADDSVRRLKGAGRPVNPLDDRAEVLAALSCVDHIVPFEDDTPSKLIRAIRPDVFVKGGDYTRETLPEAGLVEELGGEVCLLPYVEDQSTTGIIERIREMDGVNAGVGR